MWAPILRKKLSLREKTLFQLAAVLLPRFSLPQYESGLIFFQPLKLPLGLEEVAGGRRQTCLVQKEHSSMVSVEAALS